MNLFKAGAPLKFRMARQVKKRAGGKKIRLETYEPEQRQGAIKEEAVPFLMEATHIVSKFGHWTGFIISSFFTAVKTFFSAKSRIKEAMNRNEKVIDLRPLSHQH